MCSLGTRLSVPEKPRAPRVALGDSGSQTIPKSIGNILGACVWALGQL